MNDLFEHIETLPQEVQDCINKWGEILEDSQSYMNCELFMEDMNKLGYTFEYGLDASPYNLMKINLEN